MPYGDDYYEDPLEAFYDDDDVDFPVERARRPRVVRHSGAGSRSAVGRSRPYREVSTRRVPASRTAVATAFDGVREDTDWLDLQRHRQKMQIDRGAWSTVGAFAALPLVDAFVPSKLKVTKSSNGAIAKDTELTVTRTLSAASAIPPLVAALPLVWSAPQTRGVLGDLGGPLLIGAIAVGLFFLAKDKEENNSDSSSPVGGGPVLDPRSAPNVAVR